MLHEGLVKSLDILSECKEKGVNVREYLTKETRSPSLEVAIE